MFAIRSRRKVATEKDFLEDLTAKVCGVAVRFAPDDDWLIDALFEIFNVFPIHREEKCWINFKND